MNSDRVFKIKGNRADLFRQIFEPVTMTIKGENIVEIETDTHWHSQFILPGWIDAHMHLESSMLLPSAFSAQSRTFGTLGIVSDPHEIANVSGLKGVEYLLHHSQNTRIYHAVMVPSCVPASPWDLSGCHLHSQEVETLMQHSSVHGLAEVMNVPGVLSKDPELMRKIAAARHANKKIDGHCPELSGLPLQEYCNKGIETDHECSSEKEAREKITRGMKILIREGSAAKNLEALLPVLDEFPESCMFCTDDLHPDDLMKGHLQPLLRKARNNGIDIWKLLRCASLNPIEHYSIPLGLLNKGDKADFILVDDLDHFSVTNSFYHGKSCLEYKDDPLAIDLPSWIFKSFNASQHSKEDFYVPYTPETHRAIGVTDGQLTTREVFFEPTPDKSEITADPVRDILRLALINRYKPSKPVCVWVQGIGLKQGAIASSIAHDSHHILVAGNNCKDMSRAVNLLVKHHGGLSLVNGTEEQLMPLPFAGLMSLESASEVAQSYQRLDQRAKDWGAILSAPFMTLSFLGLLVIPCLKLGEKGLFDSVQYRWVSNSLN